MVPDLEMISCDGGFASGLACCTRHRNTPHPGEVESFARLATLASDESKTVVRARLDPAQTESMEAKCFSFRSETNRGTVLNPQASLQKFGGKTHA